MQSIPAEFYPSAFYSSFDEAVILNHEGIILDANEKWKQFTRDNCGDQDTYYLNHNYLEICSVSEGESEATAHSVLNGVRRVLSGIGDFRCEYPCHSPTVKRWFELTASPIQAGDKRYALVTHRNITTRHIQTEQTISSRFQQNMLAAIVATSSDAIMSFDLEGNILTWNYGATELYGYAADEIVGRSMEVLYPVDWPTRIGQYRDQILAGELKTFEVVRRHKDGKLRDVAVSASPVRDQHGEVICISNIHRDITEQKAGEEQRRFISRELSHRAKNQLAVVRSIANQTAKNAASLNEFQEKFEDRIFSMAKSIDLLVSRNWSVVSLEKLCRSQIELFSDASPDKVVISGPDIVLAPAAVEAIGMALHELGTNAVKYGALSRAAGQISVTWELSPETGNDSLRISWRETGLEFDEAPSRKGFGHIVLTQLAKRSLGSDASLGFSHHGLHWEISVPSEFYSRA